MSGKRSRQKGHNFERWLAKTFRDKLNYPYCKTSRAVSKLLDDCGVDISLLGLRIDEIPYLIQAKAGYENRRPKPEEVFSYITEKLAMFFPPDHIIHSKPKILLHKLDRKNSFMTVELDKGLELLKVNDEYKILKESIVNYFFQENPDVDKPQFVKDLLDGEDK